MGFSLAKMFTPPKSKSVWQAMTVGSTGGWAAGLEPLGTAVGAAIDTLSTAVIGTPVGATALINMGANPNAAAEQATTNAINASKILSDNQQPILQTVPSPNYNDGVTVYQMPTSGSLPYGYMYGSDAAYMGTQNLSNSYASDTTAPPVPTKQEINYTPYVLGGVLVIIAMVFLKRRK